MSSGCDELYLSVEVCSTDNNTVDESNTEKVNADEDESTLDDEGTDTEECRL